ncbi:unnamed protein product [Tuber aestivum]|uniref:Uncharacterized protein n=1 Tax=Tuber aestivum TaxID=59557 RepID=A0A292Q8P9_9PEZI|nr:unnamed protein product [Tuber aestivum]
MTAWFCASPAVGLGLRNADIDMGIKNLTGYDFATRLSEYIMCKIESNPKKSKYLETASTKILGLDVDFVNLRSESYSGDSRIPHMEFRTPNQDAHRYDCTSTPSFTIYTELVEDFTGLGLQDLAARLIRTPLPPKETSPDNLPHLLRLIRFASCIGFTIVPKVKATMKLLGIKACRLSLTPTNHLPPVLQPALKTKIPRERTGIGIIKTIKGCNPHASLSLIHEVDHYNEIFAPPIQELPLLPVKDMKIAADIVRRRLFGSTSSHPHISKLSTTTSEKRLAWFIVATSPQKNQPLFLANKKNTPAAATDIKEGLRHPNSMSGTWPLTWTTGLEAKRAWKCAL